jgi:uncharacterized protein YbjT (DUF2867 family)
VAGATGYLGRYVARAFKQRGDWVRALARRPERLKSAGPFGEPALDGIVDEIFTGEVTRPETLRGLCDGIDVMFSSIGITRQHDGLACMDVDYQGNRNLLDLAVASSVRKFVFIHTLNADVLQALDAVRAKRKFVEELQHTPIESAVICPNGFFNDMSEFFRMAQRGSIYLIGSGDRRINPIHGADLADVCVRAVGGDAAMVPVGGPETLSYREIAEMAFEVLGRTARIRRIPAFVARALVAVHWPINRKLYTFAAGMTAISLHDFVAPPTGTHTLRAFYEQLRDAEQTGWPR